MSNSFTLGVAFQRQLLPLAWESIEEAFRLNGVAVQANIQAFRWGRLFVADPDRVSRLVSEASEAGDGEPLGATPTSLEEVVAHREALLTDYQDAAYARRYRELVDRVRAADDACGEATGGETFRPRWSFFPFTPFLPAPPLLCFLPLLVSTAPPLLPANPCFSGTVGSADVHRSDTVNGGSPKLQQAAGLQG